jgi:catechol 2,3-dioxygenase-like lactoylglutathione lyase family enzyme
MFDHVGLRVKDLDTSVSFYRATLGPLGYEVTSQDPSGASFGAKGKHWLWLSDGATGPGTPVHLALAAPSAEAVDAFYKAGLAARGRDNGAPGLRRDYAPNYYAAFLLDPDGNNIEAVCLR